MTEDTVVLEKEMLELDPDEVRRYELSFHCIPTLSSEDVLGVVEILKNHITEGQGTLLDEKAPEHMRLAYTIQKDIDRKRHTFGESYFGWVQFESDPSVAHALKESLMGNDNVLRFLIVKIAEEIEEVSEGTESAPQKESAITTEEEMDKEIDKLVEEEVE